MPTPEEIAAQKAAEDAKKAEAEAAKKSGDDDEIARIQKDPEAIKTLLAAKRAANAEAKELRLKQEAAEKLKREQEDAALKEQNKFKELAEKKASDLQAATSKFTDRLIAQHLRNEALAAGSVDPDAVIALADRAGIKVDESFDVAGAKEAVEALKKSKPYLFGSGEDKVPPPGAKPPAPRGGFNAATAGDANISPMERISRGLSGGKK